MVISRIINDLFLIFILDFLLLIISHIIFIYFKICFFCILRTVHFLCFSLLPKLLYSVFLFCHLFLFSILASAIYSFLSLLFLFPFLFYFSCLLPHIRSYSSCLFNLFFSCTFFVEPCLLFAFFFGKFIFIIFSMLSILFPISFSSY